VTSHQDKNQLQETIELPLLNRNSKKLDKILDSVVYYSHSCQFCLNGQTFFSRIMLFEENNDTIIDIVSDQDFQFMATNGIYKKFGCFYYKGFLFIVAYEVVFDNIYLDYIRLNGSMQQININISDKILYFKKESSSLEVQLLDYKIYNNNFILKKRILCNE